jgi:Putative mono-oxygenase ydhR
MAPQACRPSFRAMHALIATYELEPGAAAEHLELCEQLAPSFAAVGGLNYLTWLANESMHHYGGFYAFDSRAALDSFVGSELFTVLHSQPSVRRPTWHDFAVVARPTTERS